VGGTLRIKNIAESKGS